MVDYTHVYVTTSSLTHTVYIMSLCVHLFISHLLSFDAGLTFPVNGGECVEIEHVNSMQILFIFLAHVHMT